MGIKLRIVGTVCVSILLLLQPGCVTEFSDTDDPIPPYTGQGITIDEGYSAVWDDGSTNSSRGMVTPF